jgi:hypothetical protein
MAILDPVTIECSTDEGQRFLVSPSILLAGEAFSVEQEGGKEFSEKLECEIKSVDGTLLQKNVVDTSGDVTLTLLDSFGAIRLEGCVITGGVKLTCLEELRYKITSTNTGSVELEISALDFTFNGDNDSILDELQMKQLSPGESTDISIMIPLNTCTSQDDVTAKTKIIASPPNGDFCQDDDQYTFKPAIPDTLAPEPEGDCFVDVSLDCNTSGNISCNEITAPVSKICSGKSDLESVVFSYQNATCRESNNGQGEEAACEDISDFDFATPKDIECYDEEGVPLVVEPISVEPEQSFTITSPDNGILPNKIECAILENGKRVQTNVIDTSGTVKLMLGDEFGALQLASCNDLSCREALCYNVEIRNVGAVSLNITRVEFMLTNETSSLIDELELNSLEPGQFTELEPCVEIDVCESDEILASVKVEASPPNGNGCEASDEYSFEVNQVPTKFPETSSPSSTPLPTTTATPTSQSTSSPSDIVLPTLLPSFPTPVTSAPSILNAPMTPSSSPASSSPTPPVFSPDMNECIIALDTQCIIGGNASIAGLMCKDATPPQEPCLDRLTSATMLFTGGDCSQSENIQLETLICDDFGPISIVNGEPYYVIVTDSHSDEITYFSGIVNVGETYILDDSGQRFASNLKIQIWNSAQSSLLQAVEFDCSCSENTLQLKDQFGASQLIEFVNVEQGVISCLQTFIFDLQISVPINVTGTEAITLTMLTADTNFAGFLDLTSQVTGITVEPGDSIVASLEGTIDFTVPRQYVIDYFIEGFDFDGNVCVGFTRVSFIAGGTPDQSLPPTLPPVSLPLPSFSQFPTVSPSSDLQTMFPATVRPTSNRESTPCIIEAEIICESFTGSEVNEECMEIKDPRGVTCSDGNTPSELSFIYQTNKTAQPATIFVEVFTEVTTFSVTDGQIFTLQDDFSESITIKIESNGEIIQESVIDTSCEGEGLALGQEFGLLHLVGFVNSDGSFSLIYTFKLTYRVENGPNTTILETVEINSPFQGPVFDALNGLQQTLIPGQRLDAFVETIQIDAADKFENSRNYTFAMTAAGSSMASGLPCVAVDVYHLP